MGKVEQHMEAVAEVFFAFCLLPFALQICLICVDPWLNNYVSFTVAAYHQSL